MYAWPSNPTRHQNFLTWATKSVQRQGMDWGLERLNWLTETASVYVFFDYLCYFLMETVDSNKLHVKPAWKKPQQVTQVNTDHECSWSAYQHCSGTTSSFWAEPQHVANSSHSITLNSQWAFVKTSLMFVALTLRGILQPRHTRCLWEFKMCLAQPRAVSVSNLTLGNCSWAD